MFILNANEPDELSNYLQKKGWLTADETIVKISKPGEGNMNYVMRIDTGERTFIVKQSRAYVEKYPQVAAPEKRVITESAFYKKISSKKEVQKYMPNLIGIDAENNIMVIEDLGSTKDFLSLYDIQHQLNADEVTELVNYLNALHQLFQKDKLDDELCNLEMRQLNYEHIFQFPFMENNGFDLEVIQKGLQDVALPFQKDAELKKQISSLGDLYLSNGKYLLHGDYYPGSWLKTSSDVKIIDPEFCYYGMREFDLGVFIAHLYLSQQDESLLSIIASEYGSYIDLNMEILNGFVGVEIMRRLIGLAQLPLQLDLKQKKELLDYARTLILKK